MIFILLFPYMFLRRRPHIYWIIFVVALCGFQFGYNTAVISGALLFITDAFALTALQEGVVVSTILLGAILGACTAGFSTDLFGRRGSLKIAVIFFLVGAFLATRVSLFSLFLWGRILQGIGVGIVSTVAPLYLAEVSPPEKRGAYVSINQLAITIGVFVAYGCNWFFAANGNWQKMIQVGFWVALAQGIFLFFVPESFPSLKEQKRALWVAIFHPQYRKVLIMGILLALFQQITGINAVVYFAPKIFEHSGYDSIYGSYFVTFGLGLINVCATLFSLWLIDRWGRRPLLLTAIGGMVASLSLLSLAFYLNTEWIDLISVFSLMSFIAFFAMGMGPVPWLILSEIYVLPIRGHAMGLAVFFNWLFNYLVALTFLDLAHLFSYGGVFFLYAFLGVIAFIFVWKKVPETKGKTLEEIEKKLSS